VAVEHDEDSLDAPCSYNEFSSFDYTIDGNGGNKQRIQEMAKTNGEFKSWRKEYELKNPKRIKY
jgi:hypothetical protein